MGYLQRVKGIYRVRIVVPPEEVGPYGIVAEMGAMATITLPPQPNVRPPAGGNTIMRLTDVNGRTFSLKLAEAGENP